MPVVAAALVAGLTACQPQRLDQTPSVCRASIAGSYRNGQFTSGRDRATLRFPQGAEVRVTGTVTNIDSIFGAVLPWSLSPVANGTTAEGATTNVDQTYSYGGSGGDVELVFSDQALFGLDFDWDLKLSATANGCPPSTLRSCLNAGGNFYFDEPVVIDGEQREGCFEIPSCIDDLVAELSELECDPGDVFHQLEEDADGVLVVLGGAVMWVTRPANVSVGARILGGLTIAGAIVVGVGIIAYIVFDNIQGDQAIQTRPDLVQDVVVNNPALVDRNPGIESDPDFEARMRLAMATCVADIVIDEVLEAAAALGLPEGIDPEDGLVTILGEEVHICELVPVYMPGGSTHAGGLPIQESTFHIRDVLYGETNQPQNYTPTNPAALWPTLPRPDWQVLARGTSSGSWYSGAPYGCQGSISPPATACDEFPWGATDQGGPGAHLRIINFDHNSRGGSDWNSFMAGAGCSVSTGEWFVVVPLELEQITAGDRSIRMCP